MNDRVSFLSSSNLAFLLKTEHTRMSPTHYTFYALTHITLPTTMGSRAYHYSHFTDEKTGARASKALGLGCSASKWQTWDLNRAVSLHQSLLPTTRPSKAAGGATLDGHR